MMSEEALSENDRPHAESATEFSPLSPDPIRLKPVIEALLFAAEGPLGIAQIDQLLGLDSPGRTGIRIVLEQLADDCSGRGIELKEIASGFRYQVRADNAPWISRLWAEKPARLSRALLETLALVAYRQPVTRAEIEDVRGVSVGSGVLKTLVERGWVKAVGHREVPGRPALYGTTREFLDYFNLKSLSDLPALPEAPGGASLNLQLPDMAETDMGESNGQWVAPEAEGMAEPVNGSAREHAGEQP